MLSFVRPRSEPTIITWHMQPGRFLFRGPLFIPILLVCASTFGVVPGWTADLWVDRNSLGGACSDNRDRAAVSEENPWCTLGAAGTVVLPGDTVYVREGLYTEIHQWGWWSEVLHLTNGGTEDSPIRFVAVPGESVTISGEGGATHGVLIGPVNGGVPRYVEIDGFVIRDLPGACVLVYDSSDIRLINLEVTNCATSAVEIRRSAFLTIEGCSVHHNPLGGWTSAINLWVCGEGNIVRNNFVWSNSDEDYRETEGHGILMDTCGSTGGALIENNVLWDNEGWCIAIHNSDGATVRNNTCVENSLGRTDLIGEISIFGERAEVMNNIMVPREGAAALRIYGDVIDPLIDFSTVQSDYNVVWSPSHEDVMIWPPYVVGTLAEHQGQNGYGWDAQSMQTDPRFVSFDANIFQIDSDSPAIDTGLDSAAPNIDVLGFRRPLDGDGNGTAKTDRGAYEYGGIFWDDFETGGFIRWR